MFDKEPDGTMVSIHGGGTLAARMHSARDYSGAEIMRTLRDEFRNQKIPAPRIHLRRRAGSRRRRGSAPGRSSTTWRRRSTALVRAKTVILATGGMGRLHVQGFPCTNHYGATADGLVIAYRAGAQIVFMDAIQYHPTGVAYPEQIVGQLVTEKVRGLGAQLVNVEGRRFIFDLETRDTVSAAIIRECQERGEGRPDQYRHGRRVAGFPDDRDAPGRRDDRQGAAGHDPPVPAVRHRHAHGAILIYPTQHYQNGGLLIDARARPASRTCSRRARSRAASTAATG